MKFESDKKVNDKYNNLEMFVAIGNRDDTLVTPFKIATFGADIVEKTQTIQPFSQTDVYDNNLFNFKEMYNQGRYMNCLNKNRHNFFDLKSREALYKLFNDDCNFDEEIFQNTKIDNLYAFCLYKNIKTMNHKKNPKFVCEPKPKRLLEKPEVIEYLTSVVDEKKKKKRKRQGKLIKI